jgi:hypothetical protein
MFVWLYKYLVQDHLKSWTFPYWRWMSKFSTNCRQETIYSKSFILLTLTSSNRLWLNILIVWCHDNVTNLSIKTLCNCNSSCTKVCQCVCCCHCHFLHPWSNICSQGKVWKWSPLSCPIQADSQHFLAKDGWSKNSTIFWQEEMDSKSVILLTNWFQWDKLKHTHCMASGNATNVSFKTFYSYI